MNSFYSHYFIMEFLECCFHHVSVYETFIEGVKEGCQYLLTLFPPLMFLTLIVSLFQSCGITTLLIDLFKGAFKYFAYSRQLSSNGRN